MIYLLLQLPNLSVDAETTDHRNQTCTLAMNDTPSLDHTEGVFDFTLLASLADEPGCGQPEPGSTHSRLMFDLFSPVRHAELVFVFDMVQRWVK